MNINEIIRQAAVIVDQEIKGRYRLFLFDSRVKENHNERSDIDIGILAETPISTRQLLAIQQKLEMIGSRNLLSHTYNEVQAISIYKKCPAYLSAMQDVCNRVSNI